MTLVFQQPWERHGPNWNSVHQRIADVVRCTVTASAAGAAVWVRQCFGNTPGLLLRKTDFQIKIGIFEKLSLIFTWNTASRTSAIHKGRMGGLPLHSPRRDHALG